MAKAPEKKTENPSIVPAKARIKPAAPGRGGVKTKKPAGFFSGFMTCFLIFLLALASVGAAFWFNLGDMKTLVVTTLRLSETEFLYLETRTSELADTEASLAELGSKLNSEQQDIDRKAGELAETETELATRESEIAALEASLSEQKASLDSVVAIYEAMEPDKAAAILAVADNMNDNLLIIRNMNQNKLALILAEMTPDQASEILALINAEA